MKFETVVETYTYDRFGEILYILHKNNRKYLNDSFAKYDLNLVQVMCMLTICDKNDITQKQLTEILYLTKSGITKAINNLEKNKFIIKERSKEDQRKFILKLTKKGYDVLPKAISIFNEWEDKIGLNEVDDSFLETLKKMTYKSIELNSENE